MDDGYSEGYSDGYDEGYLSGSADARLEEFERTVYCDLATMTFHSYGDCPKSKTECVEETQADAYNSGYEKCYACFETGGFFLGLEEGYEAGFDEGVTAGIDSCIDFYQENGFLPDKP